MLKPHKNVEEQIQNSQKKQVIETNRSIGKILELDYQLEEEISKQISVNVSDIEKVTEKQ